ncbi:MAG TPA: type II toxin-antitoxin system RelE/ParE family toxin [Caulobacteraceae bacterium]
MKLRIYGPARRDLTDAYDYIAQDSPGAADRILTRILDAIEMLETFPLMGRPGRVGGTRELVITRTSYIAVYEVVGETIAIVRVLHGRQEWPPPVDEP